MKRVLVVLLLTVLPFLSNAAQSVTAKMVCESVRLQQGVDSSKGRTLDISYYPLPDNPPNGELVPNPNSSYSHIAYYEINDSLGSDPIYGLLFLNIPSVTDTNTGMNGFLEVSQGISVVSTGQYQGYDSDAVVANWTRQANSATGTCTLNFGSLGVYTQQFSIMEYSGPLTYTPGSPIVSGTIAFTNSADPTQWVTGSVQFVKSDSNPTDLLDLQPFSWTNADGAALTGSIACPFYRDPELRTNYFAWIWVDDGDPSTPIADYLTWFVYFSDTSDANHNGIPDFSDTLNNQTRLTLSVGSTNVLLNISNATVDSTCTIFQSTDLGSTNWVPIQWFTVTNASQVISLPFSPADAPRFWKTRLD